MQTNNRLSRSIFAAAAIAGTTISTAAFAQCGGPGNWVAVGDPAASALDNTVLAMTSWDHDGDPLTPKRVVATGSFTTAGGNSMSHIAMWDGSAWQPFAGGVAGTDGRALVVRDNGDLVVAGNFPNADGVTGTSRVAYWSPNATTFAPFNNGLVSGVPLALASYHGAGGTGPEQLIIGGQYSGGGLSRIASWDGTAFDNMGGGMSSLVAAMAELANGDLVAGGSFTTAGGGSVEARSIARWDGSTWHPLAEGMGLAGPSTLVRCMLAMPNGDLIVGGSFTVAGPAENVVNYIARWDGTTWHSMAGGMGINIAAPDNPGVFGLALLPNGDILAGGNFATAGTATTLNVARWDGTTWHAVGASGLGGGTVHAFTQVDGEIYAAGNFTTADGNPATRIARFVPPAGAPADIGSAGGEPGSDNLLDNNDFIAFINYFFDLNPIADMGTAGGEAGQDQLFDNNDFIAFINAFFDGC